MSEPIEVLLKRLTAIARGRETSKGFHFFFQMGDASWHRGVITLQISGSGWTLLSQRTSDKAEGDRLYSAYLSTRDVRALVRILLENPFWELETGRWERRENETNIHFRLADTGEAFAWNLQIWSGEASAQPGLAKLLDIIRAVVSTVSEGELRV